jgi:hypothetical protein
VRIGCRTSISKNLHGVCPLAQHALLCHQKWRTLSQKSITRVRLMCSDLPRSSFTLRKYAGNDQTIADVAALTSIGKPHEKQNRFQLWGKKLLRDGILWFTTLMVQLTGQRAIFICRTAFIHYRQKNHQGKCCWFINICEHRIYILNTWSVIIIFTNNSLLSVNFCKANLKVWEKTAFRSRHNLVSVFKTQSNL